MDEKEHLETAPELDDRAYRFILPTFEGPLDLLLHLIRINKVDIKDIPVVEIARQYDSMVDLMQEMDLDVAGDFLVMAATLVYIKSKFLLPVDQERIEQGLEEDPRAGLVQSLLEHQRYRHAAEDLAERERLAALVFSRRAGMEVNEEGYLEVSMFDLLEAFKRLLETSENRAALFRRREEMPLAERIRQILDRLEKEDFIGFLALMEESSHREVMVVTFLAILELVRMGTVKIYQPSRFAEIRLQRNVI